MAPLKQTPAKQAPAARQVTSPEEEPKAYDIILEGGVYDGTRARVSADVKVFKKRWDEKIMVNTKEEGEHEETHTRILGYYRTKRTKTDSTGYTGLVYEARGHGGEQGPVHASLLPDDVQLDERPEVRSAQLSILEDRAYAEEERLANEKAAAAVMAKLANQPEAKAGK